MIVIICDKSALDRASSSIDGKSSSMVNFRFMEAYSNFSDWKSSEHYNDSAASGIRSCGWKYKKPILYMDTKFNGGDSIHEDFMESLKPYLRKWKLDNILK